MNHIIRQVAMSFTPVPVMTPRKAPKEALSACCAVFPPQYISERKAPRKQQSIIPTGVKIIPSMSPASAPREA